MAKETTLNMTFHECEHRGDLDDYLWDLRDCGATILDFDLNEAAEEAEVRFRVEDLNAFKRAWQKTDSADFGTPLHGIREPSDA